MLKGLRASFQPMGPPHRQGDNANGGRGTLPLAPSTAPTDPAPRPRQRKSNLRGTASLSSGSFTQHAAAQRYYGQSHGQSQVYGQRA